MTVDDERACEALIVRYTHLIDSGSAEQVSDLFANDGIWESSEARFEGQAAIKGAFAARQRHTGRRSMHISTNVAVSVDGDTAAGLSYFQLYRDDEGGIGTVPLEEQPVAVGEYHDCFVRTDDGRWRIRHRRVVVRFHRKQS